MSKFFSHFHWLKWIAKQAKRSFHFHFILYTAIFILLAFPEHIITGLQNDYTFKEYLKSAMGAVPVYLATVSFILLLPGPMAGLCAAFWLIMHSLWTLCNAFLYFKHNLKFDADIVYTLKDSTSTEVRDYLASLFVASNILWGLLIIAALGLMLRFCLTLKGGLSRNNLRIFCCCNIPILLLLLKFAVIEQTPDVLLHETYYLGGRIHEVCTDYENLRRGIYRAVWEPVLPENLNVANGQLVDLGVIVIGESATRSHHACYGYTRMTTPNLVALPKAQTVFFSDVLAAAHQTPIALSYLFTDRTLKNPKSFHYCIIDALKAMGYRVITLSNHLPNRKSSYGHITSVFRRSDRVIFGTGKRDDVLLPMFRDTLQQESGPLIVILHLRGSHAPYFSYYPENFARFDGVIDQCNAGLPAAFQRSINAYDNSILFTDHILGEVIKTIQETPRTSFLVYFSDHGDSVDNSQDNARGFRDPENALTYEIPFLIWFSQDYMKTFPDIVSGAVSAANKPLQADRLTDAFLILNNIRHEDMKPEDNIFTSDYVPQPRYLNQGKKRYLEGKTSLPDVQTSEK